MMRSGRGKQVGNGRVAGLSLLLAVGGLTAAFAGCAPATPESTSGFPGTGGATGSAGTNSTGTGKSTTSTEAGTGGDELPAAGSTGTMSTGTGESCAATSSEANLVPVNMFIMFDKSASMNDDFKWTNASKALIDFFQNQGSAGLRVALRFFPDVGCDDSDCTTNTCDQPLVALAPLTADAAPTDVQEGKLVAAVQNKKPDGITPMYSALGGAEKWATAYETAHPTEKTVVVLVTDGDPTGCDTNVTDISLLAVVAKNSKGILTYAVGLEGSNLNTIHKIATAGGTGLGFSIGNGNASAELLAALQAIQGSQVACDFVMPIMGSMGEKIDPALVNVNYTPGSMGAATTFGQVAKQADCAGKMDAWYYDNPAKPTPISLCPATCTNVHADNKAKIDILLGCATKPAA